MPTISVIMVSYNTAELLLRSLEALYAAAAGLPLQVVIVDNASRDDSVERVRLAYPQCELIVNAVNVGFGRANNQALQHAHGDFVLLLNTDAFVAADTLSVSLRYMADNPRCGILGVRLVYGDGSFHPSARFFPTPLNAFLLRMGFRNRRGRVKMIDDFSWDQRAPRVCDWIPGCYYFIRRTVIEQVGLFDERFFLYSEEVDHCRRTQQAGWQIVCHPGTTVVHLQGESVKSAASLPATRKQSELLRLESDALYFRKHHGLGGVLLNVLLCTLADLVDLAKRILKWKKPFGLSLYCRQIATTWRLFLQTRLGSRPLH